jgi:hypothetical protein
VQHNEDSKRLLEWSVRLKTRLMLKVFALNSVLRFYNDLTDSEMQAICDRVNNRAA